MTLANREDETVQDENPTQPTDVLPACSSCRKRKLKCSREVPACWQCERSGTQCNYDPKQKPGIKSGAVEALSKRLGEAVLENLLLDEAGSRGIRISVLEELLPRTAPEVEEPTARSYDAESNFASGQQNGNGSVSTGLAMGGSTVRAAGSESSHKSKRKLDDYLERSRVAEAAAQSIGDLLPERSILIELVDYFCLSFHHWIPFLHKGRLQARVRQEVYSWQDSLLLHAITTVTIHQASSTTMGSDEMQAQHDVSHSVVLNHAIENMSLISVQALVLIVFEHLNDGRGEKAWPLVGLLTRAVDYLQLTVEASSSNSQRLMRPLVLTAPARDWTELEERRRLFWVVFMFDRFCSVYTGWNTSLTSEEVRRRLPADGGFFTREEPTITPYFGIWNKSAAKIGNSLVKLPSQYSPSDQPQGPHGNNAEELGESGLGAFAYCIEAVESMSQITTFFLQQTVDWKRQNHIAHWLTRFKELDLRLVHWKMFLPQKWKHADISRDANIVNVDPNLALAHITHNVSMILLHHSIAYPPSAWNITVALPSTCSAEACLIAAIEVSLIVRKFLTHTTIPFVSVHFAFCAFIAAQALLKAHQAHQGKLLPEFGNLVTDLWAVSNSWTGRPHSQNIPLHELDQAGKYARTLESLLKCCQNDPSFDFDLINSTADNIESLSQHTEIQRPPKLVRRSSSYQHQSVHLQLGLDKDLSNSGMNSAFNAPTHNAHHFHVPNNSLNGVNDHFDPSFTHRNLLPSQSSPASGSSFPDDMLMTLSDTLMQPQFLERDRVITSKEANFWTEQGTSWPVE